MALPIELELTERRRSVVQYRMRKLPAKSVYGSEEFFSVLLETDQTQVATMVLRPGEASGEYGTDHGHADQFLFVIEGTVEAKVGGDSVTLATGDSILIEAGEEHQIVGAGETPAKTLNIYSPPAYPGEA